MTIPQWAIEASIKGEWRKEITVHYTDVVVDDDQLHLGNFRTEDVITYALSDIILDPDFWRALCKSIGASAVEINMCVGCGRAARHNEDISFGKCPKCGDSLYRYEGQWLIEMHRLVDAIAEDKVEQFWAGWHELSETPNNV